MIIEANFKLQAPSIMNISNDIDSEKHMDTEISSSTPNSKNKEDLLLHLADTILILSHRNTAWCGHGPILEQDIAITNISLDLLGQARNFYQYAAKIINEATDLNAAKTKIGNDAEGLKEASEDSLAYLRTEREFKNLLLVEQPNGDWGQTILRQYLFSQYQYLIFEQLQQSSDQQLAAIAEKAIKEIAYHVRWSSEWVIRLGDGTTESHARMRNALEELWPYTGELFMPAEYENKASIGFELNSLKQQWSEKITEIFEIAALPSPKSMETTFMQTGGKTGNHSEHLGFILAEMQYLQRTYPDSTW